MVQKIGLSDLVKDFQFPPVSYSIDSAKVSAYIIAVEDSNSFYREEKCVPPMAAAALAMAAMGEQMSLPAGSIHVSQEFTFNKIISIGDTLTSRASILRNIERGKIHMLTIRINITNQRNETVVSGETGFILPRA